MKRFIVVLSSLLVLPAFAEVAPVYYEDTFEYADDILDDADVVAEEMEVATPAAQSASPRGTANRSTSRATSQRANAVSPRSNTSSRAVSSRTTRTTSVLRPTRVSARGTNTVKPVTARISANDSAIPAVKKTSSSTVKTLTDSGDSLYKSRSVSTRRASASIRSAASLTPTTTTPVLTEQDVTETTDNLTAIAELTEYCKAQYAACMDNYCNVLDDNQGRCSCSKNVKNYEKTEQALTTATENFQEAVQKIKYIGLSADQINSLFAETEAELTMKSNSDKSQIKSSLDSIKKKILDVSTPTASSVTTGITMDVSGLLNADFTTGFDLSAFLGTNGNTTNSVSNQRGEQLFKTATARCKTAVLNSCTAQGIDANVITNSYDLEIDKQCIVYERNLNEANAEMRANISNAANILQQARLMLAQNKNSLDVRGCVAAIDSCMQDEYVCGDNYELCLDPTGKYLASGDIVKGSAPGVSGGTYGNETELTNETINSWVSGGMYGLYSAWNYQNGTVGGIAPDRITSNNTTSTTFNAWSLGKSENLNEYIDAAMTTWKSKYKDTVATDDMAMYLLQKIGYIDKDNKIHGMCASVMKQCQDYTFNTSKSSSSYKPDNEVVRQYLAAALTKIKLQQDSILADYAEDCRTDVSSCLSTNGYDENNTKITASQAAVNACRSEITTCMSVGGYMPKDASTLTLRKMSDWVAAMLISCPTNYYLHDTGDNNTDSNGTGGVKCYACPTVEDVDTGVKIALLSSGGQSTMCSCPDGYVMSEPMANDKDGYPGSKGFPAACEKADNN